MQLFCLFFPPEVRHVDFNLGSEVNLTCSTKTWNQIMFVSWNIKLKDRSCLIAFSTDGQRDDKCEDGKSLRNTSSAQSYLHIPKISNDDEGVYTCSSVYSGGNDNYDIHVAIRGGSLIKNHIINMFNFIKGQFIRITLT